MVSLIKNELSNIELMVVVSNELTYLYFTYLYDYNKFTVSFHIQMFIYTLKIKFSYDQ